MSDGSSNEHGAVRAEWRAEEERWSRAAFEHWEHDQTLADVARACMHRGDALSFVFTDVTWSGELVAVGRDVACLDVDGRVVDVRLSPRAPFVLRVGTTVGDGRRGDTSVSTFTARLRELDSTSVCIGTPAGPLEGRLRVGRDHARIAARDARVAYVPAASIWWMRPLDDD
jgi:hypothetical protein